MSNQGFRQIFKFDDANLKQLNDSLRWLYSKVTGRVEMRDLSTETKSTIDSKADGAVVGEIKETADQASKDANAAAGAVFEMQGDVEQAKQDSAQAKADAGEAREIVVSMQTSIEQTNEAIKFKADKTTVDTLSQTVSQHSTAITQTAEKIESKAEKSVVDTLGQTVSRHESAITQTPEDIRLAVESVQVGGRNYILGTGTPYTAVGTGSRQWLYPWHCASIAANRSLYGKTVTISFDYEESITSGSFQILIGNLWIGVKSFDSDTGSGHFTLTREHADFEADDDVFIYIDGTWTGSVTFSNVKVEIGNKETDWSPAPEDTDTAIAELSAAISIQTGEIISNATKIETVSQAAGNAQSSANAAQNTASGAVTRVTTAEQRISAVEGAITSKVSKTEFDALGNTVLQMGTEIRQNEEEILILAGKTVGGRNYVLGTAEPYTATGTGSKLVIHAWKCASQTVLQGLFGKEVTVSFDYEENITSGSFQVLTGYTYQGIKTFDSNAGSGHLTKTFVLNNGTAGGDVILYIDGTWTGSVTFSNVKVEIGNTATDWTPAPEDAAKSVDAGGVVRVDQTGVHMSGGTIEMETSDGDEYIHIRNDGISASSLSAPDVTPRYSGPGMLYVNPNATSEQIAKGDTFRSLADALAKLSGKWCGYNVTINLAAGMVEYGEPHLIGVSGGWWITIRGDYSNPAKLVGGLYLYHGSSPVEIDHLNIDTAGERGIHVEGGGMMARVMSCVITGSGHGHGIQTERGANVYVGACEIYDFTHSLYGYAGGMISGDSCRGNCDVNADHSMLFLQGTMPCGSHTWTAGTWAGQVLTANISVDQGSKPTPIPAPTTAVYDLMHADSYAAGNVNSWVYPEGKPNDDIYQGYTGQAGRICGCMWFDNSAIRSALNGKTIKQASIRLTAQRYVGLGREVTVYLRGTATSYSGRNGPPALTTDYGMIGTAEPEVTGTFTIPAQAISDIASGAIEGLVLYHQDTADMQGKNYSRNYMRFDGSTSGDAETRPRLTVVYQ